MDELKTYLRSLSVEEWEAFVKAFGGGDKPRETLLSEIRSASVEQIACERIRQVFGVTILTEAQRAEERERQSTEATVRSALAAEEANKLSHQANEKAERSLGIAAEALKANQQTKDWTKIAALVALLALVVSIFALCK